MPAGRICGNLPKSLSFHYSANPTPEQRTLAADLIDSGGQLADKLDRKKFGRAFVVVVALDETERVVGVAAVKERQRDVAEVGYLIVHPDFRRQGVAQELTRLRIETAKGKGLQLLFTNVRRDNVESIGNMRKAGFQFWGDFVSAYNTGRVISWFYYPLNSHVDYKGRLLRLTRQLKNAAGNACR